MCVCLCWPVWVIKARIHVATNLQRKDFGFASEDIWKKKRVTKDAADSSLDILFDYNTVSGW